MWSIRGEQTSTPSSPISCRCGSCARPLSLALPALGLLGCFAPGLGFHQDRDPSTTSGSSSSSSSATGNHVTSESDGTTTSFGAEGSTESSSETSSEGQPDTESSSTGGRPTCNEGPTPAEAIVFGVPTPVPGVNTGAAEWGGWMSPDELTIWFSSPRGATQSDIFRAVRDDSAGAFGVAQIVAGVSTPWDERSPTLTADGLTLYVDASNPETLATDIVVATRPNLLVDFGEPSVVTGINSASYEWAPNVSPDGTEIYFETNREGLPDIYRATVGVDGSFEAPEPVAELNTTDVDASPVVSADGLTLYYSWGVAEQRDIYVVTRSSTDEAFGDRVHLPELASTHWEYPAWLSDDGCRLVFGSNRPGAGGFDIWTAEREL